MGHDFRNGDIGVGQLLDFGNARQILDDGLTAPIKNIFSTPGYWSPEIFLRQSEDLRLSPATDIYSVGCLMMYLFYGMKYKEARGKDLAGSKRVPSISIPEAVRHGYRRDAAELFRKILSKALKFKPQERYQNGAAMLEDILRLKKLTAPPKFLLAQNLFRCPYFVEGSRDSELDALQNDLNQGKHPLFVFGVGGIGKTELANEFARRQIKNGTPAYFVTFKGSIRDTILSLKFSGYESNAPGSEADYRRRIDLLKENYQGCLLIVDNFDDDEKTLSALMDEPAYREVVNGTGLKILFTTRSRPDEITKELMPLDEENAMKLFTSISPVAQEDEQIVRELIREADCHPMTVELLAKTREDSWRSISYKELLQRLRHRGLDDKNLPHVAIKKNLTEREAKIYEHLRTLFDVYKLGDYRQAICHVTLLPIDGFDAATFVTNEDDDKKIQLKKLETHSWIRRRKEDNRLTIHPLIRTIFKNELRPDDDDCSDFLRCIWNVVDNSYPPDLEFFAQTAELFERATNDLSDRCGDFAFYAGFCFIATGKFSAAVKYEDKAVKVREVALADNPRELARIYNDAAVAAMNSENFGVYADGGLAGNDSALGGDFVKAMDYMNKARKILESLPEVEDKQNLANVCASTAMFLGNREDVDNALPLAQKAVDIFTEYPPPNLYEKAHAHQALAQILVLKKKYAEALAQNKIVVTMLEELIPHEHPILVTAYRDLAESYALTEDYQLAEDYALKAVAMFEKILPEVNSEVLTIYKVLTEIYRMSRQTEKYTACEKKTSEILLKVQQSIWKNKLSYAERMIEAAQVPVDEKLCKNPVVAENLLASKARDLVKYNREAAEACRQLEDYDSAEKFIAASMEKISAQTDLIEVSTTLFTAAQIYFGQRKFSEALPNALRALTMIESTSPRDNDKFSEQLIFLGKVYTSLKEYDSALKSFERAVEVQRQNPRPENAVMELANRLAAETLMRLGKFDDAEKILTELYNKQRLYLPETTWRIQAVKKLLEQARKKKLPNE